MNLKTSKALRAGFTFPDLLVSLAIFLVAAAGLMGNQIFGLRLMESANIKLSAQEETRIALLQIREAIRSASTVRVGTGSATTFTEAANNAPQQGNAIEVYPSSSPSTYVRYYVDATEKKMKQTGSARTYLVHTAYITNSVVFTAEDAWGNVLTNHANNRIIGVSIQSAYQPNNGTVPGPGYSFQIRTRDTRRALQ